jgi:hypothetical protein
LGQTLGREATRQPRIRVSRGSSDRQSKDLMQSIQEIAADKVNMAFADKRF